ncbi:hypothetical protein HGB25_02120 [Candidatus Saccharibacteria bacterium]|nr:hypothetical protein [Candidatus Saccharibacteria bacterium]
MFQKIVSNLPFSPALIRQLSFYAKRLRREEATRRLGLIFLALSLVVQCLVVFQPSESANASSETDMVTGGISSLKEFLSAYDSNTKHLRDTMNYVGITRAEIAATDYGTFKADNKLSWGYAPRFSYSQGERQHSIVNSSGKIVTTAYSRPLKLWGSSGMNIHGWVGQSAKMGWFAIMKSCGNLVTKKLPTPEPKKCLYNPNLLASDSACKPCPGNETLWIDDPSCTPNVVRSKTATNASQGFTNASLSTARPGDQVSYTITIENTGLKSTTVQLEERLGDVLEYSTIVDKGGGTFDAKTNVLSWSTVTLQPKTKQSRTFVVKLMDAIPATAVGASDPTSYDCIMMNTFGNSINIRVECPGPKIVETVTTELPKTGPTENLIFAGIVVAIAVYFYARSRQQNREIHLIRRDVSMGTI